MADSYIGTIKTYLIYVVVLIASGCAQYNYSPEGDSRYKLGAVALNFDNPSKLFLTAFPEGGELKQEKFETTDEFNRRSAPYRALSEKTFIYVIPKTNITIDSYPDKSFYFVRTWRAQPSGPIMLGESTTYDKDLYIGQNAFGATAQVSRYEVYELGLKVTNTSSLPGFALRSTGGGDHYIGLPIKNPDVNLLNSLKNSTLILAVKIRVNSKEKAVIDIFYSKPTISRPVSSSTRRYIVPVTIEEIFLIDTQRKITVARATVD